MTTVDRFGGHSNIGKPCRYVGCESTASGTIRLRTRHGPPAVLCDRHGVRVRTALLATGQEPVYVHEVPGPYGGFVVTAIADSDGES
jgi:hypothetical protein